MDTRLLFKSGNIVYREYPFPVSSLYLCGDDIALKCVVFSRDRDAVEKIRAQASPGNTAPIRGAIFFLEEYLAHRNAPLPALDLSGYTSLEQHLYDVLCTVPAGDTVSYGRLGEMAGIARGGRFAGNAMAKNRFPVFIPCHRVIREDGTIGNYTSGADMKEYLLSRERGGKEKYLR